MKEFRIVLKVKEDETLNKFANVQLDDKDDPNDPDLLCKEFTLLEPATSYEVSVIGHGYGSPVAYVEQKSFYFRTLENPCASSICVNGDCTVTGENSFHCMCLLGYYGPRCEQFNACSRTPCDEYECTNTTENLFYCSCPDGRQTTDPDDCSNVDPCVNHKCDFGICVAKDNEIGYTCECHYGYEGPFCTKKKTCTFVNCHNNGTCVIDDDSPGGHRCICQEGFIGRNCEKREPCHNNHCLNGAKCVTAFSSAGLDRSFECKCAKGFMGEYCEMVDGCAESPCENGATCTPAENGETKCECRYKTYGKFCQYREYCDDETCGAHGECKGDPAVERGYVCKCNMGYFGIDCQIVDPCLTESPCVNGGECVSHGNGSYSCLCEEGSGLWGKRCQFRNECIKKPCKNHGECINNTKSALGYSCQCRGDYDGRNCEIINKCKNSNFCNGHGTCSQNECTCDYGYYGDNCQSLNACQMLNPCKHSGECKPTGDNEYNCECGTGYHGGNCQMFDPCEANPCYNGGGCILQDDKMGYFTCECSPPYYGNRCELINPCLTPDAKGVCPSQFKCLNTTTGHLSCVPEDIDSWISDETRDGSCTSDSDCFNKAKCEVVSSEMSRKCVCEGEYTGNYCEKVIPCKMTNPCNGHGECRSEKDNTAKCECDAGWFGPQCEIEDACSGGLNCFNGGNCVRVLDTFTKTTTAKCHCLEGFSGDECKERAKECQSNHCKNGGQCLSLGWRMDEESFRCVCPPTYTGLRCETLRVCLDTKTVFGTEDYIWPRTAAEQKARLFCHFGPAAVGRGEIDLLKESVATRSCALVEDPVRGTVETKWKEPDFSRCIQKPSLQLAGKVLQTVLDSMGRYWPWGYSPSSLLPPEEMSPSFEDPGLGGGGGVTTPNADAISAISQTAQLINVLLPNLFKFSLNNSTHCELMFRIINRVVNFPREALVLAEKRFTSATGIRDILDSLVRRMPVDSSKDYTFAAPNLEVVVKVVDKDPQILSQSSVALSMRNLSMVLPGKLFISNKTPNKVRLMVINFRTNSLFVSPFQTSLLPSSNSNFDHQLYSNYGPNLYSSSGRFYDDQRGSANQNTVFGNSQPEAPVVSISVENGANDFGRPRYGNMDEMPVLFSFLAAINSSMTPRCVYWKDNEKLWSSQGVHLNSSSVVQSSSYSSSSSSSVYRKTPFYRSDETTSSTTVLTNITCLSTHLTAFSFIMSETGRLWDTEVPSVLPFVGVGFAIVGYTLTIITYCLFSSLRGNERQLRGTVTINLALSLLLLNISFIVAALRTRFDHSSICDWVALSMHYFTLTTLLWFVADAVFLFQQLSTHFEVRGTNKTGASVVVSNGTRTQNGNGPGVSSTLGSVAVGRVGGASPNSGAMVLNSQNCLSMPALKYFVIAWVTPLLIIVPMLMINNGELFHINDIYCRITDQSEQIAYYLSLAVPAAIVVIVGLCVYLFVILWIYCCKNCCSHSNQLPHMPLNDGYLETLSSTLSKNTNCHQQHHLLNPGSNPSGTPSPNNFHKGPTVLYDTSDASLTAFKKHVLSMTILLALFSATWLFAQSLDLQTFDFVFCFANVTQSWLFFSEKCILLSEARNAWKRLFNNAGADSRNEDTARGKLLPKNSSPANYGGAVSPTHSLVSTMKDTLDKRELINNHSTMPTMVNRNHSASQSSIQNTIKLDRASPASATNPILNSSSNIAGYDTKSPSYNQNKPNRQNPTSGNSTIRKETSNVLSNGNFHAPRKPPPDFISPTLPKNSLISPNNTALESLSVFTSFAGSDPSFYGHSYSPTSRECLEGGDAYGATYMQSANAFERETPSACDSDPNRESYV
ncbi:uncharacterized protein LOC142342656 isoform X2 [Convolutriloba macropyga]